MKDSGNELKLGNFPIIYMLSDLPQLLFSMFISHLLMGNPLFGAALYLLYAPITLWTTYYRSNLNETADDRRVWRFIPLLLILASAMALLLILIYPFFMHQNGAIFTALFILLVILRNIVTDALNHHFPEKTREQYTYRLGNQIVFALVCAFLGAIFIEQQMRLLVLVFFFVTGLITMTRQGRPLGESQYASSDANIIRHCHSYSIYSQMAFNFYIAFYLAIMMYIFYASFFPTRFRIQIYCVIAVWFLLAYTVIKVFYRFILKRRLELHLSLFFSGAAVWVVSFYLLFRIQNDLLSILLTFIWAFGLVAMYSVITRLQDDFKIVSQLAGNEISDDELKFDSLLLQIIAAGVAGIILLILLTLWSFFNLRLQAEPYFPVMLAALPIFFLLLSMVYALRLPINDRNRHRLTVFARTETDDAPQTQERLQNIFIRKYRMRFGARIIMALLRPFLRLKVYGKENIDFADFPCVFVCNHRRYFGPCAAVIYLPVYFRPWVDRRMVDDELIAEYMYTRGLSHRKQPSEKVKRRLAAAASHPVRWLVHSFDPIRVEKTNPKGVMQTLHDTTDALLASDNVLLFPEKQEESEIGEFEGRYNLDSVGDFYTGFAHIGKLYYEKTGQCLRFYPTFFAREKRSFNIGTPVVYNPENGSRSEKQRISDELRNAMLELERQANAREKR